MSLTDSRLPQTGCEKLELSMMSFLDHIRKIYVSEQEISVIMIGNDEIIRYF